MRYERPRAVRYFYSIAAVYGEDAIMLPEGPLVLPGSYQVRLRVEGKMFRGQFKDLQTRLAVRPDLKELSTSVGALDARVQELIGAPPRFHLRLS